MFYCLPNLLTFSVLRFPRTEDLHLLFPGFLKHRFSLSLFSHVWRVLFHLRAVLCWIIRGWETLTCSLLAARNALKGSILFITCTSQIWLIGRYITTYKNVGGTPFRNFFCLCSVPYYSGMRSAALVPGMSERYLCNNLVWKPEGKRQLGRSRRGWKDNIKICLQKVERRHGLDWPGSG